MADAAKPYFDCAVIPVKDSERAAYLAHAAAFNPLFTEFGAHRVSDCWADDVPHGTHTDFFRAVQCEPGEVVALSVIEWPSKAVRDAGMAKMRADPRMRGPMPFDGRRMIFGGFEPLLDLAAVPSKVSTFLWFDGQAEAAAQLYVSLVPRSSITRTMRSTQDTPSGTSGSVMAVDFLLDGQRYTALNGGPHYKLTPAMSIMVRCADQAEIDRLWTALLDGGGSALRCGWLTDRFGVTWQIAPEILLRLLSDPDRAKAGRVMAAMMQQTKLEIAPLLAAAAAG
jgi:predicted 3-demethylubiquinone-9 3-methyltransferase (glyoxalase superfamily)/uncharacterized protein YbaA (DUF1428 family)